MVAKRTTGKDFNYFKKIEVTSTEFTENSDVEIWFSAFHLTLQNEGTGATNAIEYSFNGNTVHGDMIPGQASAALNFDGRPVTGIWFRVKSGSTGPITVRVEAWSKL